jgi:hypothetical protein
LEEVELISELGIAPAAARRLLRLAQDFADNPAAELGASASDLAVEFAGPGATAAASESQIKTPLDYSESVMAPDASPFFGIRRNMQLEISIE